MNPNIKLIIQKDRTVSRCNLVNEKGGAITEFSVMMIVLVPMFLMIPMMGKIGDMNSSSIQASRYAAWERTISDQTDKSDAQLKQEIQNRFFSKIDIGVQTGRGQLTNTDEQNALWRGYGEQRLLRSAQDDVNSGTQASGTPGNVAGAIESVMTTFASAFSSLSSNANFDVNMNGLYRADIAVEVGSNNMGFDGTNNCAGQSDTNVFTCIQRHNVILTDTWSSASAEEAETRTRSLVPMAMFDSLDGLFDIIGSVPGLEEFSRFEPGYVDSNIIAPDRLGAYEEN